MLNLLYRRLFCKAGGFPKPAPGPFHHEAYVYASLAMTGAAQNAGAELSEDHATSGDNF